MAVVLGYLALTRFQDEPAATSFRPTFALPDETGTVRTSGEFQGKHLLVFFGFTNCPDVCPTTMMEVAEVMDVLGSDADEVQPLFISIDPERDRALGLTEYVTAFHPSILGLAGDDAATRTTAESFKIFYDRDADANAPDGYTMSHSPALYLVGPNGDWLRQYSYGTPAQEILDDLKGRL
ncbi:SCO family protein [Cereibacter sp. SYSU M97828]|nr:SCO family protein [Cereibacter flavus]